MEGGREGDMKHITGKLIPTHKFDNSHAWRSAGRRATSRNVRTMTPSRPSTGWGEGMGTSFRKSKLRGKEEGKRKERHY